MTKNQNVLLVEDEPTLLEIMSEHLRAKGVPHITSKSSEEALSLLQGNNFGLVVSDISLPEKSAFELIKAARSIGLTLPFILITGHFADDFTNQAREIGAIDILQKPFSRERFNEAVLSALSLAEKQR
jgi:DNA-binding NtrC family response regulator